MFYDPESDQVLDFVGGQKDLDARLIRFIGDAEIRIKEDHLRIIRAIRFKNSLNFQYHPATYTALSSNMELVNRVSAERIRQEFCKMIMCDNNLQALNDMEDLGLLKILFPEIQAMKGVAQPYQYHQEGDVWNHSLAVVGSLPKSASLNVRLAALLHDIGKAVTFEVKERIRFDGHAGKSAKLARDILERLKFSRKDIEHISWLISHHMMMVQLLEMNKGRQRHWFSHPWFRDLLVIFYADASGTRPKDLSLYEEIFEEYCRYKKELPEILPKLISGEEVMEILQIPAGKKLGEILESLYLAQLEGQIEDSSQARDWVLKNRSKFFK
jgi:poly(A) polymerase